MTLEGVLGLEALLEELKAAGLKDVLHCGIRLFREQAFAISIFSEQVLPTSFP